MTSKSDDDIRADVLQAFESAAADGWTLSTFVDHLDESFYTFDDHSNGQYVATVAADGRRIWIDDEDRITIDDRP